MGIIMQISPRLILESQPQQVSQVGSWRLQRSWIMFPARPAAPSRNRLLVAAPVALPLHSSNLPAYIVPLSCYRPGQLAKPASFSIWGSAGSAIYAPCRRCTVPSRSDRTLSSYRLRPCFFGPGSHADILSAPDFSDCQRPLSTVSKDDISSSQTPRRCVHTSAYLTWPIPKACCLNKAGFSKAHSLHGHSSVTCLRRADPSRC